MAPKPRKQYGLDVKAAALADIATGMSQAHVSKHHNIPSSTLAGWVKKKGIIQVAIKSGRVDKKRIKDCLFPKTEAATLQWLTKMRNYNAAMNGNKLSLLRTFMKKALHSKL